MNARLLLILILSYSISATAETIHFDLLNSAIEDIDETEMLVLQDSGLQVTLSTLDGVLNRTGSGFGVNADGAGDDTNGIDNGSGIVESISIFFSASVLLDSIQLAQLGNSDIALLTIGATDFLITAENNPFSESVAIAANDIVVLAYEAGNGFSFDGLTVTTSTVPLPTALLLFLGSLTSFIFVRK